MSRACRDGTAGRDGARQHLLQQQLQAKGAKWSLSWHVQQGSEVFILAQPCLRCVLCCALSSPSSGTNVLIRRDLRFSNPSPSSCTNVVMRREPVLGPGRCRVRQRQPRQCIVLLLLVEWHDIYHHEDEAGLQQPQRREELPGEEEEASCCAGGSIGGEGMLAGEGQGGCL